MEHNYLVALIIYGIILMLTLIGIIVVFIVIHKQRTQKYKEALLHTRIEVQEQALDWVSREIHDNIGQILSLVRMQLHHHPPSKTKEDLTAQMNESAELIEQCIKDLRNMSHTLNGKMIEQMDLSEAIERELTYVHSLYKVECDFTADDEPQLTGEQKLLLFRITQECLNNIVRHARATAVLIRLQETGQSITLIIEDNGKGMDVCKAIQKSGMGLSNIKERTKLLNGSLDIKSSAGKGCKITITINN